MTTEQYSIGYEAGYQDGWNEAQKPFVGLTDEDFQPAVKKAMVYYGYKPEHSTLTSGAGFYELVRAIEAKLKEKNSYA